MNDTSYESKKNQNLQTRKNRDLQISKNRDLHTRKNRDLHTSKNRDLHTRASTFEMRASGKPSTIEDLLPEIILGRAQKRGFGLFLGQTESGAYINIYKNVIKVLGTPDYLDFWWSEREKALLIAAAKIPDSNSLYIAGYTNLDTKGLRMGNKKLLTTLKALLGLEADVGYKAWGEYYTELKMVAFRVDAFQVYY